jgi:hypothetical protein
MACRSFSLSFLTFTNANLVMVSFHIVKYICRVCWVGFTPCWQIYLEDVGILATDGSILATDVVDLSGLLGLLGLFHLFF